MTTVDDFTTAILAAAAELPLEWFVFAASFVEEIVSPIPTYAVMVTAGSISRLQNDHQAWILLLAALGALGKTAASLIYYYLAKLFETVLVPRFGRYFGISAQDIEAVGQRLQARRQDRWLLVALRVLPVVPSVPVSIVAGLIKIDVKLFMWTTFLGNYLKNVGYLLIGYFGFRVFEDMLRETSFLTHLLEIGMAVSLGLLVGWFLWHRNRQVGGR